MEHKKVIFGSLGYPCYHSNEFLREYSRFSTPKFCLFSFCLILFHFQQGGGEFIPEGHHLDHNDVSFHELSYLRASDQSWFSLGLDYMAIRGQSSNVRRNKCRRTTYFRYLTCQDMR